jgi:5-carboxymethyl-2-hydroxymuconate isomerase
MPHLMIDYSANIEPDIDMSRLCEHLRAIAAEIEAFPIAGVKVRAVRVDHYAIADGNPAHGFIDISVRIREGRDLETKKQAVDAIFNAANDFVSPIMQKRSLALSVELRDITAELAPKSGTIRKYLRA